MVFITIYAPATVSIRLSSGAIGSTVGYCYSSDFDFITLGIAIQTTIKIGSPGGLRYAVSPGHKCTGLVAKSRRQRHGRYQLRGVRPERVRVTLFTCICTSAIHSTSDRFEGSVAVAPSGTSMFF